MGNGIVKTDDKDKSEQYQKIQQELDSKPGQSLYKLCRAHGISYTGFKYWKNKQRRDMKIGDVGQSDDPHQILLAIPIEMLQKDYVAGAERITIDLPLEDVLSRMSPAQLKRFVSLISRK